LNTFFTSDQHYRHKNICEYAGRPFTSVEEMDEQLIKNHNETVSIKDEVWFLGDFGFMNESRIKTYLRRLNGKKNLILGNHDKPFATNPHLYTGKGLLNRIYPYKEINIRKQHLVLFHYGMRVWNRSHHGAWHLYGHSHGALPPHYNSVDVGVDSTVISEEYRPYSFEEIEKFMISRGEENPENHK
jgi:calcineurin-like phosphoesterase family protein